MVCKYGEIAAKLSGLHPQWLLHQGRTNLCNKRLLLTSGLRGKPI